MAVFEYVLLFRLRGGCGAEQGMAALEALWGLQFSLPGCLCAFGGPVLQESAFLHIKAVTHALHMRFSSHERAEAFRRHPIVEEAFRMEVAPVAVDIVEVLFEAAVGKDMDAIFRKSADWDSGAEHLLVCRGAAPRGSGSTSAASAFLQRLAVLARESRSEALQTCVGSVLSHPDQWQAGAAEDVALMARFPTKQQLRWFVETPPYQALLAEDARLPQISFAATCELLPPERQHSKSAPLQVSDR